MLPEFATLLQGAVADCLTVEEEGGHLTADEIEVRFREPGPYDVNYSDLQIEVTANWYATRAANLSDRVVWIAEHIEAESDLPSELWGTDNFVWVVLGEAGFRSI